MHIYIYIYTEFHIVFLYVCSTCILYSGKAAIGMLRDMKENPSKWKSHKVLFIHTGGLLGLFDKVDEMKSMVGKWRKMEIDDTVPRVEGTGKMF